MNVTLTIKVLTTINAATSSGHTNILTKCHRDQTINFQEDLTINPASQPARQPARIRQSNNPFFPSENLVKNLVKNIPSPASHTYIIGTNVLTKFHHEKCPAPGDTVIQPTRTIFDVVQVIIETNILTKFDKDQTINVASRPYTRPYFSTNCNHNKLVQHIIGINLLTKFHEDQTINLFSRVLTSKNASPPGSHFHEDQTINGAFRVLTRKMLTTYLARLSKAQDILRTNVLTKCHEKKTDPHPGSHFHDDWANNVTSRKTAPSGSHVIQLIGPIFQLNSRIKETNVLTKFHENRAKNVTSRVFTCFRYIHIEKNAPPTGGHVFSPIWIIFKLVQHINKTNVLINFHDDWAKIVTSRVFTRKTASPTGGHVFQWIGTTFELNQHIINTDIETNFKLDQDGTNLLTMFHDDRTINVASRVFRKNVDGRTTDKYQKTAPPTGGHAFQRTRTTFELNHHTCIIKTNILTNFKLDRDFIGTKLLTKFHEDRTINVASRVFTNKC
ncbi:hypothetical protein DPMN_171932 [Dreissena polymorpha]|uniref:Uncharacterized protein n=1 Tax=Dreissena polymorpha TaxID=45954 RepID=A0A9D4E251_DREPO|nr:hypothetical protein DPMN_171932 [Dreissena polymorpha]